MRAAVHYGDMLLRQAPLQLWLSLLGPQRWDGVVARDGQRAFAAWRGEDVVFLLPTLRHEHRWRGSGGLRFLALRAEHLERLDVFHIAPTGAVWGPDVALRCPGEVPELSPRCAGGSVDKLLPRFPGGSINGLLPRWTARPPDRPLPVLMHFRAAIRMRVPAVRRGQVVTRKRDGAVAFEDIPVLRDPGPITEMAIDRRGRAFRLTLTGSGVAPAISLDAEALANYTPAPTTWQGFPGAIGPDGRAQPRVFFAWSWPWFEFFSVFDGYDPLAAQERMRALMNMAQADRAAAIREAQAAVAPVISPSKSTLGLAQFWPTYISLLAAGQSSAAPFWAPWGLTARTFEEARSDSRLDDPVVVTRVWGGVGLFWMLCLAELEARAPRFCTLCGWLLTGTARQYVCGPQDNPACHHTQRNTARQRQRTAARLRQQEIEH